MAKPYAGIICPFHGSVDIDFANYSHQMAQPDARWKCPKCGSISDFDDERYEEINYPEE